MDTNELNKLKKVCEEIREAIEVVKSNTALFLFFPKGCCRDVSLLIATYLIHNCDYQSSDIRLCSKDLESTSPSHTWLKVKGVIVDITADQFGLIYPKTIVLNENSKFFFHREDRNTHFDLREYRYMDLTGFFKTLDNIKEYIASKRDEKGKE